MLVSVFLPVSPVFLRPLPVVALLVSHCQRFNSQTYARECLVKAQSVGAVTFGKHGRSPGSSCTCCPICWGRIRRGKTRKATDRRGRRIGTRRRRVVSGVQR